MTVKDINRILIYSTSTREDRDYTFEDLKTPGYHYYIRKSGLIYRTIPLSMNDQSVSVAYEGGLGKRNKPKDTRTPEQKEQILSCILDILKEIKLAGGNVKQVKILPYGTDLTEGYPCFGVKEEFKDITNLF